MENQNSLEEDLNKLRYYINSIDLDNLKLEEILKDKLEQIKNLENVLNENK